MPKHNDQRVGIFVDVQNLYYSAKQFYNTKVNFAHILHRGVAGRRLIRAIAYVIRADIKEEVNFFEALEKIGYDIRSKDLQTFYGGAKKGDWDVGIAMDIMRMAAKLDVVVLVSGDGDFTDLIEHVKALGCRAEVIAFGKTSSSRLLSVADEFLDLGKELPRVLIREEKYTKKPMYWNKEPTSSSSSSSPMSLIQKINLEQPPLQPVAQKPTTPITLVVGKEEIVKEEKKILTSIMQKSPVPQQPPLLIKEEAKKQTQEKKHSVRRKPYKK